ncbi:hypothetical protein JTB14_032763 [Gonioctena quinquepunctata]|nr:hypothetical protein JTB14_032763 [Gonioctena quinquepunctata]
MGNCFQTCLPGSASKTIGSFTILDNETSAVDIACLVDENASYIEQNKSRGLLSRFFKKRTNKKKPVLQLVDGLINPQVSTYSRLSDSQKHPSTGSCTSRDIQLQFLDARALLQRTTTSTPASSLDLEWEHETLPISMIHDPSGSSWTALPEDVSLCPSNSSPHNSANVAPASDSDWSRVSSSDNSLEWDNVHNSIHATPPLSEVDTDTQFLLCEIERLTNKTLEETGQELFS